MRVYKTYRTWKNDIESFLESPKKRIKRDDRLKISGLYAYDEV